jgi:threonine/homoserine/homoserine lactone efflux protein
MSFIAAITLFTTMVLLAALPSASVALVVSRSITLGVANGVAVSAGIVLGDLVFIVFVMLGLSVLAEALGSLFAVVKYIGATYLLWLGASLVFSQPDKAAVVDGGKQRGSLVASFLAGFLLTLGDLKAIFFYLSLLPIYVDLAVLQLGDALLVVLLTLLAVGGTKVLYAVFAARLVAAAAGSRLVQASSRTAGVILIGAGSYIVVKS